MHQAAFLLLAIATGLSQTGCSTSCGKHTDPLLWADGTVRESNGSRIYETTPIDAVWLHFPSYRKFQLPHGLGTKDLAIDAYVSLAVDRPVVPNDEAAGTGNDTPSKFAIATAAEVLTTIVDPNTVVVENTTCENGYYLFVRISDKAAAADTTTTPAEP